MARKSKYEGKFAQGQLIGRWTVIDGTIHGSPAKIALRCECGVEKLVDVYTITQGKSTSCGCTVRVGESAPNWRGISGVSRTLLARSNFTIESGLEAIANQYNAQAGLCALTGTQLTSENSATVTLTTSHGVSGTVWVTDSLLPLINASGGNLDAVTATANAIVKNSNIFDQLGMTPIKEK